MLFFKKQKPKISKVDHLKKSVTHAFTKVKEDTSTLYQWIEYLSAQNRQLQLMIEQLQNELKVLPRTDDEIRAIVDKHYSFEHLFSRLESVEGKLSDIERGVSRRLDTLETKPTIAVPRVKETRQKLQETIARRISKNSKEYIKNILFGLVTKYQNISGPQLKEMVVEEQKLCSKSSFYRLLEELEQQGKLGVVSSGKMKYFTVDLSTRNHVSESSR